MHWTVSNRLTMARVLLIPIFAVAFYFPGTLGYLVSTLLFTLAAFTDWLDGYFARTRGEETAFGRFLDPVADKLLVATALVLLVEADRANGIIAAIIIGREITIGALREWLAEHATVVQVSVLGKAKTMLQMLALGGLLIHIEIYHFDFHFWGTVLLWLAALLTLWSGYEYIREAWPELISKKAQPKKTETPEI